MSISIWQQKLDFLLEQEALAVEPALKFALRKQIEEAREKIQELSAGGERTGPPRLDLGRLPVAGPLLIGRETELARRCASSSATPTWNGPALPPAGGPRRPATTRGAGAEAGGHAGCTLEDGELVRYGEEREETGYGRRRREVEWLEKTLRGRT